MCKGLLIPLNVGGSFLFQDSEWPADRRVNPNLSKIAQLPKFNYQGLKGDVVVKTSELPASW